MVDHEDRLLSLEVPQSFVDFVEQRGGIVRIKIFIFSFSPTRSLYSVQTASAYRLAAALCKKAADDFISLYQDHADRQCQNRFCRKQSAVSYHTACEYLLIMHTSPRCILFVILIILYIINYHFIKYKFDIL